MSFSHVTESDADCARVGFWGDHEIVFHSAMIAVIIQINPRINPRQPHPSIGGNVATPARGVATKEIICLAGKLPKTPGLDFGVSPSQSHCYDNWEWRFGL